MTGRSEVERMFSRRVKRARFSLAQDKPSALAEPLGELEREFPFVVRPQPLGEKTRVALVNLPTPTTASESNSRSRSHPLDFPLS